MITRFIRDEQGATLVEYMLVLSTTLVGLFGVGVVCFVLYCMGVLAGVF